MVETHRILRAKLEKENEMKTFTDSQADQMKLVRMEKDMEIKVQVVRFLVKLWAQLKRIRHFVHNFRKSKTSTTKPWRSRSSRIWLPFNSVR